MSIIDDKNSKYKLPRFGQWRWISHPTYSDITFGSNRRFHYNRKASWHVKIFPMNCFKTDLQSIKLNIMCQEHIKWMKRAQKINCIVDNDSIQSTNVVKIRPIFDKRRYLYTCWNWKEGNVLFNDALNTFYLRLYGVRYIGKGPLR